MIAGAERARTEATAHEAQRTGRRGKDGRGVLRQRFQEAMTLQEAKSIARHLGLTLRKVRSGDYCVKFREGEETTAWYSDNLEEAIKIAVEMARKRAM
jgi:hypothetical protein